jgi:hypothetical protein
VDLGGIADQERVVGMRRTSNYGSKIAPFRAMVKRDGTKRLPWVEVRRRESNVQG